MNQLAPLDNTEKTSFSPESAAPGAAVGAAIDPDLAEIAKAWPTLPDAVRATILAMVRAAATGNE